MVRQNMNFSNEDWNNEVWKKIEEFDNYDVSNLGRVRKFTQPKYGQAHYRYISFSVSSNGSLKMSLTSHDKKIHGRQLAKMVYETFTGRKTNDDIVFADGDKTNCSLDNLWTSQDLLQIAKEHVELKHELKY